MISLPALETQKTITQYKLDIWQEKQGFAHNSVVSICQTRDGYIWLGTLRGLVRFDGIRFTTFKKDNTVELKDNVIKALFEDHKGTLWIGTSEGGLSCLKKGVFKNYSLSECKGLKEITTIFEDREGTLWIGTLNSGLSILKNGRFKTHTTKDGLPADRIRAFCENKDGALLIATSVGLIIHSYPDKYRFYKGDGGPFEKYIIALCNTGNDGLWIGCNDGLYLVKEKEIEYYGTADGLPNPVIKCLYKDKDGNIWGGTDGGGLIRLKNGRLEIFSSKDGLGSDSIYSILEDREGCIWLGTLRGGLHRLRDTVITPFTTKEGLSHNMVTSLSEEKDGGLWVGMKGGGVNRLEGPIVTLKLSTKQGLLNNNVNSVVDDGNGSLWIATDAGLNQFRDDKMTGFTTRSGLSHNNTQDVWSVKGGALWIYTLKNLDRFNNGVISVSTEAKVLHKKRIQYIHEKGGETWFATDDGLYKLNNGTLTAFTISEGLVQNEVECIHEDKDGILYIGTRGGLSRMAEGEFCNVTTHTGLADSYVRGIAEDDFGYLWLAGRTGISRIDKKELDAFALGKINRLNPDLFNESDGMKNPWCEECIKTRDGRLWFTTDKGIVMIEPTNIKTNTLPPPVKIEELIVDGDKVNINGPSHSQKKNSLVIPPGNKRMEFYYAALSFIKPRKIKFKLKLDGFDNNWIDAGSDRKTTYTGLSPGNYTFRVTACNCDGVWNKEGTSLSFYIKPYFYQTPWFYVTVSLFLLLSVFTFYRFRIRQLKAREKELSTQVTMRTKDLKERNTQLEKAREKIQHTNELIEGKNKQLETQSQQLKELNEAKSRFFANISHEFRTPLTLIMGPLEQILAANPDTALKNQAHLMLRNSHRLLNQVNQLLDLAKFDSGKMKLQAVEQDIVTFMKSIVLCFESLAQQENVTLEFQAKEETLPLYFDPDKLEKVLLNLLSNAFKYTTSGGSIRVLMRKIAPNQQYPEGFVVLTVQDTGTGIPPDQLPHIFERFFRVEKGTEQKRKGSGIGLALTKDLVELHHGTIAVIADEEKGIGTEFTISLPLGKSHLDPLEIAEPFPQSSESPTLPEIHQERKRIISNSSNELLRSNNGVPRGAVPWPAGRPPGGPPEASLPEATVLVVEDNPDVRHYIKGALELHFHIEEARDGKEGIRRAKDLIPDLIVSDVMMPGADGNHLCRTLKEDILTSHIPIILLTARVGEESELLGLESGADDYITKPFSTTVLAARAANLIQLRSQLHVERKNRQALQPAELPVAPMDDAFYKTLQETVEEHLADTNLNVETLAELLEMSQATLLRKIQGLTGKTPVQFIRAYRLKRAAQLLEAGAGLVSAVATKVGFASQAYFAKCFKDQFHRLPSDIRAAAMAPPPAESGEPASKTTLHWDGETASKPVVLVVEDNDDARNYITGALEKDYHVLEAKNGTEAAARAMENIPDLVISDVMMPGLDGFDLCKLLKKDLRTSHIPVILLTAKASETSILQGLETGADDYVIKPFNTNTLQARIKNLIHLRRHLHLKRHRQMLLMPEKIKISPIDHDFTEDLEKVLKKHHSDDEFTIEQMAEKLYMSKASLYRKIRAVSGESPTDYLRAYRLNRAARLLQKGFGTVTEVAFEVGFKNRTHFSRSFKEKFNTSPSSYSL